MLGMEELSQDDRQTVTRARRLERFLTQPFFSTEQFTGKPGKLVSLDEALDGCDRILNDEFADYSERALYMIGTVDEAEKSASQKQEQAQEEDSEGQADTDASSEQSAHDESEANQANQSHDESD